MKRLFTSLLLMMVVSLCWSQEIITFSSDQGLSNTRIRSIYEDSHKNIWITTSNGLNRWDGVRMNVYHHDDKDGTSLGNNTPTEIIEYEEGKIIVGTVYGLQMYDYSTDDFTLIPIIRQTGDTISARITSLSRLNDGSVNVCTAGMGNFIVGSKGKICARQTNDFTPDGCSVSKMLVDRNHRMWILTTDKGVYTKDKGDFCKVDGTDGAIAICEGMNGVYIANRKGELLSCFAGKVQKTALINLKGMSQPVLTNIRSDQKGNILICTDGDGLLIFNEQSEAVRRSEVKSSDFDLASSNVKDAMIDHEGNLWIGVYWKGVIVQKARRSVFNYIGHRSVYRNSIGTNCVTAISVARDGWLWVATDHCGLYRINPDGTQSNHYDPEKIAGLPSTITAIYEDNDGKVWLGSSIGSLAYAIPQEDGNIRVISIGQEVLKIKNIYSIVEDNQGTLWIGTMGNGLYGYDLKSQNLQHFTARIDGKEQYPYSILNNIWISSLVADDNYLYIGTPDGLEIFQIQHGRLKKTCREYTGQIVSTIKIHKSSNTLWIGTSLGLIRARFIDGKVKEQKRYDESHGLPNNMVNSIEIASSEDPGSYHLWVSTDNGMCQLNSSDDNTISHYYFADGLQGNEFSTNASTVLNDNLYFGGINGITYFNPSSVHTRWNEGELENELRIVNFFVRGEAVKGGDKSGSYTMFHGWISEANRIDLCSKDNSFYLDLATMSLLGGHIQYQYKVNNGEWTNVAEGQNRVSFSHLDQGTYHLSFRIRPDDSESADVQNSESTEVLSLTVVIHSPWYESWWAWLLYLLVAAGAILFVFRQYKERNTARRILETHRQSEMLNEIRTKFFMDISHEIRTPMTLIMAPLQKLHTLINSEENGVEKDKIPLYEKNLNLIHQNADRIMTLVNQLMDVRKIEKGQFPLNYDKVELVSFIRNLYNFFSENARSRNIDFNFKHECESLSACVDPQNLDKILMNLLSNAFKFTPEGGKITIHLDTGIMTSSTDSASEEPCFVISVTDNGIGIPDEQKKHVFERFFSSSSGTGIGLNLSYMLAQLHEGTLAVSDNPEGAGTQFTLTMPQALYILESSESPDQQMTESPGFNVGNATEILIVEDDEHIRQYIRDELIVKHSNILQFSNGQEAWNYMVQNPEKVALVISDIMMPLMNGTVLCKKIKQNFNTNHIPVILLTAKVSEQEQIEGLNAGADEYVTKPFSMDVLSSRIANLLSSRKALQSKYKNMAKEETAIDDVELVSPDEQLMQRVMKTINENMDNPNLSVEFIADKVGVSRVHFHRKIKELTNQTPRDFVKGIRLRQAAKLLQEKRLDITAVSEAVGFKTISSFSTAFKQAYGVSPNNWLAAKTKNEK